MVCSGCAHMLILKLVAKSGNEFKWCSVFFNCIFLLFSSFLCDGCFVALFYYYSIRWCYFSMLNAIKLIISPVLLTVYCPHRECIDE